MNTEGMQTRGSAGGLGWHGFGPSASAGIVVALVLMLSTTWVVLGHNAYLRSALSQRAAGMAPTVGEVFPPLQGVARDGAPVAIEFNGSGSPETLFFVFSTDCSIALSNWPQWQALLQALEHRGVRVVFVNLATGWNADLAEEFPLPDHTTLVTRLDPQSAIDYNLMLSPMILRVSATGELLQRWTGRLTPDKHREVLALFQALAE